MHFSIIVGLGEYYNFSPFIITDGEINILTKILHEIGGEKNYKWGNVRLSIDKKGGFASIFISYKRL